jgi:sugar lactone lactonase YvrE
VAGGNGAGSASNQLNHPNYIRLSNKTGAMYIVDYGNNRIQRWQQGATSGVTIAGNPYGHAGSNATMLSYPIGLAINANETQMYVTDATNSRIQRFQLI